GDLTAPQYQEIQMSLPPDSADSSYELEILAAPMGDIKNVELMHEPDYVDALLSAVPASGLHAIDADTSLCPASGQAALRGVGAVTQAVDMMFAKDYPNKRIFCATRPPGHHAEPDRAMGFCLFNNVAIGAAYAAEKYGAERVAVIDFDVHHGNGTEACFLDRKDFLFVSTHQSPLYPGTGQADFAGQHGNILNCPLPAGADGDLIREVFRNKILPRLENFQPGLILVSAGFDGHENDPLAQFRLIDDDYFWMTKEICDVANKYCQGRVISVLEGGYDLNALQTAVKAHLDGLAIGL
ncbi:MAG: histone deacetylase family protein, partial [Alphaproteobacteria bacterium]|nr:histone deacetylase family protein [Alphaproteobacteria bacterium]